MFGQQQNYAAYNQNSIALVSRSQLEKYVNIEASIRRNNTQQSILRKILSHSKEIPRSIFELIKSFLFGTPFIFTINAFQLVNGSKLFYPMSQVQFLESQRQKDKFSSKAFLQQLYMERQQRTSKYVIKRNAKFYLEDRQSGRGTFCQFVDIWKRILKPRQDKMIQYNTLLSEYLKRWNHRSIIICETAEQPTLTFHIENIVRGVRNLDFDTIQTSVLELTKRDSIWVTINTFNYLVFSSNKKMLALFNLECTSEGEWQFGGENLNIWSENVKSRQRCLIRFNLHEVYLCGGSSLLKCNVYQKLL